MSLKNFILPDNASKHKYIARNRGGDKKYPERESTQSHGGRILRQFEVAKGASVRTYTPEQVAAIQSKPLGRYVDVYGQDGYLLNIKSLESSGIELCNFREEKVGDEIRQVASIFMPIADEHKLLNKIQEYIEKETPKGNPKNNDLVRSIECVRATVVESIWTDQNGLFPGNDPVWCEVWLRGNSRPNKQSHEIETFFSLCDHLGISHKVDVLRFPARFVCLIRANKKNLHDLLLHCADLAEYRKAPELNVFFIGLDAKEQRAWVDDLVSRTNINPSDVSICLYDTGVNDGHPLLASVFPENSTHAISSILRKDDTCGHGTEMAGIAAYGDLADVMVSSDFIEIHHSLESVKICGNDLNEPELYGEYTKQAVATAEVEHPEFRRAHCLAITAPNYAKEHDGRASSWSAAIDSIAFDDADDKRLFLISASNVQVTEYSEILQYPDPCIAHGIEDPGQSWNALTVGGYTKKIQFSSPYHAGYHPVAEQGGLSPFSATSRIWSKRWPIKPEILCEAGNAVKNDAGHHDSLDDLSVLTTSHRFLNGSFTTINGTSAAVAEASRMAAQLMVEYPQLRPETIRALMVASAEWTDAMKKTFCPDLLIHSNTQKGKVRELLQACGYGVADIERARYCTESYVNMITESELTPYSYRSSKNVVFNEMNMHEFPWPTEYLLGLGETSVSLKVVLSYFIEPSPGEGGWKNKYQYASCGLRFDVNNPGESSDAFAHRISAKMESEENNDQPEAVRNDSSRWLIGEKGRTSGSLHCDTWNGTAADLCGSNFVAVYPTTGWWKMRPSLEKYDQSIRYSLVVALSTPATEVELYTKILTIIPTTIAPSISIRKG